MHYTMIGRKRALESLRSQLEELLAPLSCSEPSSYAISDLEDEGHLIVEQWIQFYCVNFGEFSSPLYLFSFKFNSNSSGGFYFKKFDFEIKRKRTQYYWRVLFGDDTFTSFIFSSKF